MMALLADLKTRFARQRAYNRTVAQLRAMSIDVALDLDIYAGDAEKIAAQAVYGR